MAKNKVVEIPSVQDIVAQTVYKPETSLDRVYRENNVTQELINKQPKMTKLLNHMGGLDAAAEYLRGSEDTDAQKFVTVYDRIYHDRDFLEYEGICAAAQVSGKKLFGMIVAEVAVESEYATAMITSINLPDIVEKTAELAKLDGGHRERALFAKASGWLPRPKGSQTNIQINTANVAGRGETVTTLPDFDTEIRELGEGFQNMESSGPKMLEGKVD